MAVSQVEQPSILCSKGHFGQNGGMPFLPVANNANRMAYFRHLSQPPMRVANGLLHIRKCAKHQRYNSERQDQNATFPSWITKLLVVF
ncbi:hypothetical protein ASC96_12555 [Rhizobium sp. Root1204]|nr:hypothetical protein ASC96_12555 [Rhizobium sp. Root1204]